MENSSNVTNSQLIRRYNIVGSRRFSNLFWAIFLTFGGVYFLSTGFSSYFGFSETIQFFPQGLVMSFYGILAIVLSFYLWLTILWEVGGGFNEFNKQKGTFRFFRWGFPGKNRRIDFTYPLDQIEALRLQILEGMNPQRILYIRLKEKKEIPLTGINQPITLEEIEKQASDLAMFLEISLDA